jgi:hypothetical protein
MGLETRAENYRRGEIQRTDWRIRFSYQLPLNSTQHKTEKPMTKQNEIETLLACAKTLGGDSYCGPWLLDQIPFIESDIISDMLPTRTWTETRRIHDEMLADARKHAAEIVKTAEEKAARIASQAETHAKTVRENLRRDLQRAADIL